VLDAGYVLGADGLEESIPLPYPSGPLSEPPDEMRASVLRELGDEPLEGPSVSHPVPIAPVRSCCHAFVRNTVGTRGRSVAPVVIEGDGCVGLIDFG
jgi:hypothetical protein